MQLFSCWIFDAGQSIEGMINKIKSFQTPQCLSVTQIPGFDLLLAKNATGHHRLLDFPTFKQNVLSNLGLTMTIESSEKYKMLIWTGTELRFTDVEAQEMVVGSSNPNVRLAQEIYQTTIRKESEILQQLQALKLFATSSINHQKRSLLSWIFSTNFGEKNIFSFKASPSPPMFPNQSASHSAAWSCVQLGRAREPSRVHPFSNLKQIKL